MRKKVWTRVLMTGKRKDNKQQKKGQRPKHGTLEIENEEGSTTSARPSKSSTLEDLFGKCTGRRSNDSEEVSLSPLRIPPGHSDGSPTMELYCIARHERPSRLRYLTPKDYYIPTKADLESPRRLELLCQRLREIDLISESPRETGGEIRRGSSFSKPDLLVELAGLTTTEKTGSGKLFFLKGCFCFPLGRTRASSSSSSTAEERCGEKNKRPKSGCFSFLWARKCADKAELEDELTDIEISSPKMARIRGPHQSPRAFPSTFHGAKAKQIDFSWIVRAFPFVFHGAKTKKIDFSWGVGLQPPEQPASENMLTEYLSQKFKPLRRGIKVNITLNSKNHVLEISFELYSNHPNKTKFEDTFSSQAVDVGPEPQSMAVDLNPEYYILPVGDLDTINKLEGSVIHSKMKKCQRCRRNKHLRLATRKKKSPKAAINLNLKLHTIDIWGREKLPLLILLASAISGVHWTLDLISQADGARGQALDLASQIGDARSQSSNAKSKAPIDYEQLQTLLPRDIVAEEDLTKTDVCRRKIGDKKRKDIKNVPNLTIENSAYHFVPQAICRLLYGQKTFDGGIIDLCNLKADVKNKVHSIIDKFAECGLHSLVLLNIRYIEHMAGVLPVVNIDTVNKLEGPVPHLKDHSNMKSQSVHERYLMKGKVVVTDSSSKQHQEKDCVEPPESIDEITID
ncbi:hypothetical protein LguiB_026457 [Lonicera macranthoides]